jgi:hypothetical protein
MPPLAALAAVTLRLAGQAEDALEAFGSMRLQVPEAMARGLRAAAEQLPGLARSLRCHAGLCVPAASTAIARAAEGHFEGRMNFPDDFGRGNP